MSNKKLVKEIIKDIAWIIVLAALMIMLSLGWYWTAPGFTDTLAGVFMTILVMILNGLIAILIAYDAIEIWLCYNALDDEKSEVRKVTTE